MMRRGAAPHLFRVGRCLLARNFQVSSAPSIPVPQVPILMAGGAAEAKLVLASEVFRVPGPYLEAAEMDHHEAKAIQYWVRCCSLDGELDETLFLVLASCYIARGLSEAERKLWEYTLPWRRAPLQISIVVDFVREQLLSGKSQQMAACLHSFTLDEDASELIEELWTRFCKERNILVSPEEPERADITMELVPPPPFRKPGGEFRWRCSPEARSDPTPRPSPLYEAGLKAVPKFFALVARLMSGSSFFYLLPVDRQAWNMRKFAADGGSAELSDALELAYSQLKLVPVQNFPKPEFPGEIDSAPLQVKDLVLLLEGIQSNKLLRSLVTERPPLFSLTHQHAINICMQRARIWLARYDLRIYYNHSLTYARLGTEDSGEEEEERVFLEAFCKERTPSFIEYELRKTTFSIMWEKEPVVHMRPEDYDRFQVPDTELWRALKRHVGHPVLARRVSEVYIEELRQAMSGYMRELQFETKSKRCRDGQFPPINVSLL